MIAKRGIIVNICAGKPAHPFFRAIGTKRMRESFMIDMPVDAPCPRVIVTAGPTAEDIDPVRYLTNRSSGRMGVAIAEAVADGGGTPLLILGPGSAAPPPGITVVRVRSAENMRDAVLTNLPRAEALVMAAAVADYTPAEPLATKLKKSDGDLYLRLRRTPDILREVAASGMTANKFICGFSLDVGRNRAEAERKLREKDLDMIVANATGSFGGDEIAALLLFRDGVEVEMGLQGKEALAKEIVIRIRAHIEDSQGRVFA